MNEFIGLIVLIIAVVAASRYYMRSGRHEHQISDTAPPQSLSISLSVRSAEPSSESSPLVPDTGAVRAVGETGWWLLNPSSDAPMTVAGLNQEQAEELKRLLDQGYSEAAYQHTQKVMAFLLRTNARWGELEDYIERAKALYQPVIADQQRASAEWKNAGERDRDDLLAEFRRTAINSLDVRPYANLTVLLEAVPGDATLDDLLLEQYGFEALQLYLRYVRPMNRARLVPVDSQERAGFEQLVKLGLARRGIDIPVQDTLGTCTLKQMTDLVTDISAPPFRRKRTAIDYLITLPDIQARLGRLVAFREIFQLLALPERFAHINLEELAQTWRHTHEVADLMHRTYVFGGRSTLDRANFLTMTKGDPVYWTLLPARDDKTCPSCRRAAEVGYRQDAAPLVPLHVGCRCSVLPNIGIPPDSLKMSSSPPRCQLPAVMKPFPSTIPPRTSALLVDSPTQTIEARKVSQHGKARFALPDGFEGTVEEVALHHYQQTGWHGVWGENHLWWMIMALLFWDIYFADLPDAWDPLMKKCGLQFDMPRDLFTRKFYARRRHLIADRMITLKQIDVCTELTRTYSAHIGTPCRLIERWDKFPMTMLQEVLSQVPRDVLLSVLQRLLENFMDHRAGLPDLLLWKDDAQVWAEVKGPGDTLSVVQQEWLSFLHAQGGETRIIRIVDQHDLSPK
ncbi:MAG: VRR-NUC domain-containing protein [Nitrospira sp.]|nr:VRR-NUC domain-containing protein [Nitrospira sp.]MDH4246085.1 VRR-NUC domain-containing protein [Nitrospira sp.]MDH4356957.1 VRR-NUC domain-containing protein [Nitrospira sp.]MDH5318926.1 VRR-NUC domain-containing protein [Nitrospira sp.]